MAFKRQRFIQTMRDDFLKGAFGEFMCRQVALRIGEPYHRSNEVRTLLSQAKGLMDPETKTHFKDRGRAVHEAVDDLVRIFQTKVTYAKTKVSNYYPEKMPAIQRLKFDPIEQLKLMVH